MIGRQALIYKTYRHEKMIRDKKDDNVEALKDDEYKFIIKRLISSNYIIKFDADGIPKRSDPIQFF